MNFTPRLNDVGILNNFHWYSANPFYIAGYGMPNCTCYAWGRFWEISDPLSVGANRPSLPTGDAGNWWYTVNTTIYETGSTPRLGAVICFSDDTGGSGHVAIVEEIDTNNGTITTSNSAWQSTYFYTQTLYASNNYKWSHYTFQGFIYNPDVTPTPPTPTRKSHKFPWVIYARKFRERNY